VLAQCTHVGGQRLVVRRQRAGIAERSEVLAGIEAVRGGARQLPRTQAVSLGPVRLARVLDDGEAAAHRDLVDRAQVGELSVEVDGNDEARPLGDGGFDLRRVEVPVLVRHVDDDRTAPCLRNGFERRDERRRRHNDLVSRLDSRREERLDRLLGEYPQALRGPDLYSLYSSNQSLISSDGIHPTWDDGYAALRREWAAFAASLYP